MQTKAKIIWKIISLVAILILGIVSIQIIMYQCLWWNCAPERDFTIYDLTLPNDLFPPNANALVLHPTRRVRSAVEDAGGASYWGEGRAILAAERFATSRKASAYFESETTQNLFTSPLEDVIPYNSILKYQSDVADEYDVNCGYIMTSISCMYSARYQEFYIFFNGYLSENGMTQEDFLDVIVYIDSRMQELLK